MDLKVPGYSDIQLNGIDTGPESGEGKIKWNMQCYSKVFFLLHIL